MTESSTTPLPAWLARVERIGNALPHPAALFALLCAMLWPLTAVLDSLGAGAIHPVSGEPLAIRSLLSAEGFHFQITTLVSNFTGFAPLGIVLVAMLGIGIAERSGLLAHVLKALVRRAPDALLTPVVAFAGVLSSMAADAGYVVLVPLAALLFQQAGRSPLIGIAVAFAGVSGGFSANVLIGPVDALLAGISTEAAALVAPEQAVRASANYWFMLASTVLVTAVVSAVAGRLAPRYPVTAADPSQSLSTARERRALLGAGAALVAVATGCILLVSGDPAPLRESGQALASSAFIRHIVVLVALGFALCGLVYGALAGRFRNSADVIGAMEETMATLAGYLVLMFFAAQFVAWFGWSGAGLVLAIKGAALLAETGLAPAMLLVLLVLLTALINLFIGSASAKWALIAPVLVPMMLLLGVPADATQAAFRVGDSTTNIITPLMPYFALVLGFARHYQPDAGIGTLAALMLPFSLALLASWSLLLWLWVSLGWPLGF